MWCQRTKRCVALHLCTYKLTPAKVFSRCTGRTKHWTCNLSTSQTEIGKFYCSASPIHPVIPEVWCFRYVWSPVIPSLLLTLRRGDSDKGILWTKTVAQIGWRRGYCCRCLLYILSLDMRSEPTRLLFLMGWPSRFASNPSTKQVFFFTVYDICISNHIIYV